LFASTKLFGGRLPLVAAMSLPRLLISARSAAGAAAVHADLLDRYLIDPRDAGLVPRIGELGPRPIVADALMRGRSGEARLARVVLRAALGQPPRRPA
jgi:hypothetical protein